MPGQAVQAIHDIAINVAVTDITSLNSKYPRRESLSGRSCAVVLQDIYQHLVAKGAHTRKSVVPSGPECPDGHPGARSSDTLIFNY